MAMYTILRMRKLHSVTEVRTAGLHNFRRTPTPNADPDAEKPTALVGTGNIERDYHARLKAVGNPKPLRGKRVKGVVAIEIMITASGEFFDRGDAAERSARIDEWAAAVIASLRDRWGENLVNAGLHLDETTPHVHAVAVPLVWKADKRRRDPSPVWMFSARDEVGGGSDRLVVEQDRHFAAMNNAFPELVRGEPASVTRAKHIDLITHDANMKAKAAEAELLVSAAEVTLLEAAAAKKEAEGKLDKASEVNRQVNELREAAATDRTSAVAELETAQRIRSAADEVAQRAKAEAQLKLDAAAEVHADAERRAAVAHAAMQRIQAREAELTAKAAALELHNRAIAQREAAAERALRDATLAAEAAAIRKADLDRFETELTKREGVLKQTEAWLQAIRGKVTDWLAKISEAEAAGTIFSPIARVAIQAGKTLAEMVFGGPPPTSTEAPVTRKPISQLVKGSRATTAQTPGSPQPTRNAGR